MIMKSYKQPTSHIFAIEAEMSICSASKVSFKGKTVTEKEGL